jgi:hypothetical protein
MLSLANAFSEQDIFDFFSNKDNPRFDILEAILKALGYHFLIEPIKIEIDSPLFFNVEPGHSGIALFRKVE